MASQFAQFHQQPMNSIPHDLNFNTFHWDNDQNSYLQNATYDDSSFMAYPQQTYGQPQNESYSFNSEQFSRHGMSQHNMLAKGEYTFDQQPPVLSSTSDSGASIQSAMSSNMGSPSAQPQHTADWQQQFNINPSILQPESGIPTSIFESGTIPTDGKIGCVGECTEVSSFHNVSFLPSSAPFPRGQPSTGLSANGFFANSRHAYHMSHVPPHAGTGSAIHDMEHRNAIDGVAFSSPPSPASSIYHFPPRSPVLERVKGQRRTFAVSSPRRMLGSTRLARSSSAGGDTQRLYAPQSPTHSPFFSQSSGHFVPPLGSSCPSPFLNSLFSLSYHGGGKSNTC